VRFSQDSWGLCSVTKVPTVLLTFWGNWGTGRRGLSKIRLQFRRRVGAEPWVPAVGAQPSSPPQLLRSTPLLWHPATARRSPCSVYTGRGGDALEIQARSVLNAKQPVSTGLVLIWAKDWINVRPAPSTESEWSQWGQAGGPESLSAPADDAAVSWHADAPGQSTRLCVSRVGENLSSQPWNLSPGSALYSGEKGSSALMSLV